ncbi:MAG: hypothetical protein HOA24_00050 [Candidatus Pacebacteria bacterium]|nr:hypothetical protein [Candidatus Paceibacterota bacterium]MBT3511664.1 hypothetical protein [Candidatus Paceibacterota bacterium]MBT4004624.1 hypothetical protein [Candidatus Paceibacterota bacterium]MBT4358819.1 hypothetical protein [Candidatus Paceibacterota bacterium]MBT4680643.1 hypothetical protein [Candidatus Paceibacterota bacterium]
MSSPASVFEPKSSKLATIFLVFISIFSLFGLFYFYLQTQLLKQQLSSLQTSSNYTESTRIIPKPTLTPSASPAVDSPLFQIKELSLTFQLPVKLLKKGNWETITLPSDTGNNICFHLLPSTSWLVKSVKAGGVGICSGKYLTINSVSSDFTAGRGGSFTDISGYHIKDGQYFLGLDNSEGERPLTTNSPKEVATSNGLKYLFITGESIDNPGQLLPDKYVGALINTSNPKYPGIVIAMELSDQLTVVDFSQILDTLKFE